MNRFFGMMPASEVDKEVRFYGDPDIKMKVTVEAGPNGWTILFADRSTRFRDNPGAGTEANYKEAYDTLKSIFPNAYKVEDEEHCEILTEW